MRIARPLALIAIAILTMALIAVLGRDNPSDPVLEASAHPRIGSTTTHPGSTTSTTENTPVEDRQPDVDAMGSPVGDLLATTTTVPSPVETSASAKAPSAGSSPPTTAARAVNTPTTSPPTTTTAPAVSQAGPSGEFESQFASRINKLRTGSGLDALSRDGALDSRARSWAERMAEQGDLSHSKLASLLPPWSAAAENVGMGGSVKGVFNSLAGSSGHKTNMLGDYTHLGVGVWVDGSGTIWTVHIFTR